MNEYDEEWQDLDQMMRTMQNAAVKKLPEIFSDPIVVSHFVKFLSDIFDFDIFDCEFAREFCKFVSYELCEDEADDDDNKE